MNAVLQADKETGFRYLVSRWCAALSSNPKCTEQKNAHAANLAIGGNWAQIPDASTPFPGDMQIDYIHAYLYTGK